MLVFSLCMFNCCVAVFVKRGLQNLFTKRKLLTLTMSLNIRDIEIEFEASENRFGVGLDFSPSYSVGPGKLLSKFVRRVRGLSG